MPAENTTAYTNDIMVCPGCDLLLKKVEPTPEFTIICPRCRFRLHREQENTVQRTLALAVTGLLLFLPAMFYPLMTFNVMGKNASSSVLHSTLAMFSQGHDAVGVVVALVSLVFPLVTLSLIFWVSTAILLGWRAGWVPDFMRWYQHLTEWAMTDVYLIGIFITIIKMSHMAEIQYDIGFYCFIGLVLATIGAQASLDKHVYWKEIEGDRGGANETTRFAVAEDALTGQEAGLVLCHTCHKTMPGSEINPREPYCPRCGESMHQRKQNSISRSWALVFTAAILSLPANLLPIMEVEYFGNPEANTIMDGIIYFFQEGSYGIGAVILTASILVPLFKILGMSLILCSIHFRWSNWLKNKTQMFRFIEFIGRWSMLDIFVIALLTALVQFGYLSTIRPAAAALYFTGVVLCTMFAAISFDSRLLWDIVATESPSKETLNGTR
jgi:paraquat-inducible protein A